MRLTIKPLELRKAALIDDRVADIYGMLRFNNWDMKHDYMLRITTRLAEEDHFYCWKRDNGRNVGGIVRLAEQCWGWKIDLEKMTIALDHRRLI